MDSESLWLNGARQTNRIVLSRERDQAAVDVGQQGKVELVIDAVLVIVRMR